ncbi:ribosomal protein S18-alanine N-acetyltransferase [uncultured Limosilactobacillus sp.]|uniref:ribosomal protein S18-alanine N-acetyltransferase n=1 Tax=uncultured Limosilactobacillus sp. TaxID=2837629 RepID=UPI0025E8E78B|nr:ribosomal protein S18-alanine N-acetyltransferase [uncultured Limosilactobacillus sp.]
MFRKFNHWLARAASGLAGHPVYFAPQTLQVADRSIVLQPAQRGDIEAMVEIERRVYQGYAPWGSLAFTSELSRQHRLYLVATDDNYIIGFVGCSFNWVKNDAHITNIAVTPGYQRQGLGTAMLRALEKVSTENGMLTMSLEVRVRNSRAQRLYRQLGFQKSKIKHGYYEDDHGDALEMLRPLGKEEKND